MSNQVLTLSRRQIMPMVALGSLGLTFTKAYSATNTSIVSPTMIWNRKFNPNSALRPWSINAKGDLWAPTSLQFELRPGDQTSLEHDIIDNRERSEISGFPSPLNFDQNYRFTSSFTLSGYTGASTWLIFMQVK